MLDPRRLDEEFALAESRTDSHYVVRAEGPIDVHGAVALGGCCNLTEGERRLLLDLCCCADRSLWRGFWVRVLRIDRYAERRDARLVVLWGSGDAADVGARRPQGLIAVATTPAEAEALLGWPGACSAWSQVAVSTKSMSWSPSSRRAGIADPNGDGGARRRRGADALVIGHDANAAGMAEARAAAAGAAQRAVRRRAAEHQ